ncbi:ribosomal protein L22/L17 [Xylaria intraflava]|nr:ribosomal protein L22/L17 [Xylaria intraflava]
MNLHLPVRQVANAARASIAKPSTQLQYLLPQTQRRNANWFGFGKKKSLNAENPDFAKALTRRQKETQMVERLQENTQGSSIFDEDIKGTKEEKKGERDVAASFSHSRMKEHMQRSVDPDPRWRVRYQRKKIMQMVRAGGKMTKEERLKLTEKEYTLKSGTIPTSTKKLVHLSHQIAGKSIDDAITQMRFSKKKMARELKFYLESAKYGAIAARGMGLGEKNGEIFDEERNIVTKDGKRLAVRDPTALYVEQSWVTKGPYRGARRLYHARGRGSVAWRPTARINLVLKEEKTRIRLHDEREAKAAKKAPWVHLPNRPVTAQRPYYSW